MARAPRAGACKTRLEPLLGPEGCAALQAELLRRAARLATHVAVTPPGADLGSVVDGVEVFGQRGGDLGARMAAAVARAGAPAIVVGTDLPSLSSRDVAAAEDALIGADVVFGPAADGGYWLVGVRDQAAAVAVFGIDRELWGGPQVLERSLAAARAAGLRTALLDERRDLDTPQDAVALLADARTPPAVARCLSASSSPR